MNKLKQCAFFVLAATKAGQIYFTSTLNFSVKVFDKDFKFVKTLGKHGDGTGMSNRRCSLRRVYDKESFDLQGDYHLCEHC